MSEPDETVFLGSFWPTPKTPARIKIELNVRPRSDGPITTYDYSIEVAAGAGILRGAGGEFKAESKQEADLKAMFKLVNLLGEMLADAAEEKDRG